MPSSPGPATLTSAGMTSAKMASLSSGGSAASCPTGRVSSSGMRMTTISWNSSSEVFWNVSIVPAGTSAGRFSNP